MACFLANSILLLWAITLHLKQSCFLNHDSGINQKHLHTGFELRQEAWCVFLLFLSPDLDESFKGMFFPGSETKCGDYFSFKGTLSKMLTSLRLCERYGLFPLVDYRKWKLWRVPGIFKTTVSTIVAIMRLFFIVESIIGQKDYSNLQMPPHKNYILPLCTLMAPWYHSAIQWLCAPGETKLLFNYRNIIILISCCGPQGIEFSYETLGANFWWGVSGKFYS